MRLNQVSEVFGSNLSIGDDLDIGEARIYDMTLRNDETRAPIDIRGWTITRNVKAYTADGPDASNLTNFAEMNPQPGELAQVSAAISNAMGGHIRLRVPKTIFASLPNPPAVNATRELPVLAIWVFREDLMGEVRVTRHLILYRNGGA